MAKLQKRKLDLVAGLSVNSYMDLDHLVIEALDAGMVVPLYDKNNGVTIMSRKECRRIVEVYLELEKIAAAQGASLEEMGYPRRYEVAVCPLHELLQ